MSKALKIIDWIIIAIFIAAGAALIVPQFMGIDTVTVQQDVIGNVDVGSTIYAKKESSSQIQAGDRILDLKTDEVNVYTVTDYNAAQSTVTVTGGTEDTFTVSSNYLRVVAIVPLIGYLMIAAQSVEGLIMLAVILVFVIVLFVASEAMKKGSEEDDEEDTADDQDDEEDDDFYKNLAEKRKKAAAEREEKKKKTAAEDADPTASADGMTEISRPAGSGQQETGAGAEAGSADGQEIGTGALPDVQAALEAALESQPLNRPEETNPTVTAAPGLQRVPEDEAVKSNENGEIELAMPVRTADELLQKAYADGLDPKVEEDSATGVTLVDYSDCI